METVEIFAKRYRRYPLLKLSEFEKNSDETLTEFIENFLMNYNRYYHTYKVKKNIYHCGLSRNRSIQDIFGLCRYYFKRCTFEEVLRGLFEAVKRNEHLVGCCHCPDVRRYVFNKATYMSSNHRIFTDKLNSNENYLIVDLYTELGYTAHDFYTPRKY